MRAIRPLIASVRVPVLAGLIALLLGGCVSTLDRPVEVAFADQTARAEPDSPRASPGEPVDHGEWRLRLSYL